MANRMPTRVGDVLVLLTRQSFVTHAIGMVHHDGQQDFATQVDVSYVSDRAAAMQTAEDLGRVSRSQIFFRNMDTDDWSVIASRQSA